MKENRNIEFKRELNAKLEKEIVAFLNSNGGHIYIGINDNGSVHGLENIDKVQLSIRDIFKDKISPSSLGFFEIIVEKYEGKDVVHIIIASGNEKPYYIKKKGMCPEGCFMRVGSSSIPLTEKQIFDMFSKRVRTSIRNIDSPLQNLTFKALRIYYEESGHEFNKNTLAQLNLLINKTTYNYLAFLVSDQNSLVINVGKFKGKDVVELEDTTAYTNQSLIKTTFDILNKIENYNKTFTKITGSKRFEVKMFDTIAMREAVINAVVHSDYSYENTPTFRIFDDHIEIISVGGLPKGIEKKEFLSGYMSPKNPQLMKIFRDVNLVEHMGTGIIRILSKYDKSIYEFSDNFIKVSIPFKNGIDFTSEKYEENLNDDNLTNRQKIIIGLIKDNQHITQEELANKLTVSRFTIIREIKTLIEKDYIKRIGSNKTGYWKIIDKDK